MQKILVAGSTGYLGGYIVDHLKRRQMDFKAIARNTKKLASFGLMPSQIRACWEIVFGNKKDAFLARRINSQQALIEAQVTKPSSLVGCCKGIAVAISTLGITRHCLTKQDSNLTSFLHVLLNPRQNHFFPPNILIEPLPIMPNGD